MSRKIKRNVPLLHLNKKEISTIDSSLKHTSEHDLLKIIKQVRRRRQKQQDEQEWKKFYQIKQNMQEQTSFKNAGINCNYNLPNFCDTDLDRNMCDVDELNENTKDELDEADVNAMYLNEYNFKYTASDEHFFKNSNLNILAQDLEKQLNLRLHDDSPHENHTPSYVEHVCRPINKPKERNNYNVVTQPQPLSIGVLKKMEDLASSLCKIGDVLLRKQGEEVDLETMERNLKRNKEFATLFARNYVYPLKRQKKEAKKILIVGVPLPQQKLALMFQTFLQSIQTYERHLLKFSCHKSSLQQLLQIVDYIQDLVSRIEKVMDTNTFPHRHDLVNGCVELKRVLIECSNNERDTISSVVVKKKVKKSTNNKKVQDKLSMYVSHQAKPCWKQVSARLARAKFGPPSFQKYQKARKEKQVIKNANDKDKKTNKSSPNQQPNTNYEEQENMQESKQARFENTKAINKSFRSLTRAVPEESVVTMMEMLKPQALPNLLEHTEEIKNADNVINQKVSSTTSLPKNIQILCVKYNEEANKNTKTSGTISMNFDSAFAEYSVIQTLFVSKYDREIALLYKDVRRKNLKLYDEGSKPWDIVTRISDEVTFDIVQNVCLSIENFVDNVVKKLFETEFK